jgi:hypothetical protein
MRYRAPLLNADGDIGDHFKVLTYSQFARFAMWSLQTGKPVNELMEGLIVEESEDNNHTGASHVVIEGTLPHCGLHGVMLPDGSTHT